MSDLLNHNERRKRTEDLRRKDESLCIEEWIFAFKYLLGIEDYHRLYHHKSHRLHCEYPIVVV